jgi:N-acetylneuraminic acid mutarotase
LPVAPLGVARSHLGAASVGGAIYALGGAQPQLAEDGSVVVERYDVVANAWTTAPSLPVATDHAAIAASDSQIFVLGGTFAAPSMRAFRFDAPTSKWTAIASLPEARAAAGAAFLGGRVFLVGGFGTDRKELAAAYSYEPAVDRWERIADLPTPREHLAVIPYRSSVCALGGHLGQANQTTVVVECYDPSSRRWSSLPPLLRRAADFDAAANGGEIWAVGDDVQVFNGTQWSLGPSLGTPRYGVAAVVLMHTLYVIGGAPRRLTGAGVVERIDLP